MRKNMLVLVLVIALVAALAAPAAAQKKKRAKGPKPYASETVTVMFGHPVLHSASEGDVVSITAQDFRRACAIPPSNGLDGAVFEIPEAYQKINSQITGSGTTSVPVEPDIDIYAFDKDCNVTQAMNAEGEEEVGLLEAGAAFVFMHNYAGGPTDIQFELKPVK
jgi:hypothetical protein